MARNSLYSTSHQLPGTEVRNSLALGRKEVIFPVGNLSTILHCLWLDEHFFGVNHALFCIL